MDDSELYTRNDDEFEGLLMIEKLHRLYIHGIWVM